MVGRGQIVVLACATALLAAGVLTYAGAADAAPDTIFGAATPATIDSGDGHSVELGVKFSSEVAGNVTGVRFYKASTNTGTHIGSLWSASGTLLAQATFTGETASGWQQVSFATPVAIAANTTYVAAYFAPTGHYSDTSSAFASSGVSNPPLRALASSVSPDGVYTYSATSTFPTSSYKATNYWVDVDFEPAAATAPGQATNVTATAGAASANLTWSAPSSGSPVTSYTITPYVGSTARPTTTVTGSPAPTSATVKGLTSGTSYTFTVQASNSAGTGPASAPSNAVTPTAVLAVPTIDANVTVNGHGTTTTSFDTTEAGEPLLALVGSDGPSGAGKQTVTVSGAGLTWTLVKRANSRSGDAEIWTATASKALEDVTVTSTPALSGYDQTLTVISLEGSKGVGASVTGGVAKGAPSVQLTTTEEGSLVFGVGNDWDSATARTLGPGQTLLHQYLDTQTGDTYWSQYASQTAGPAGSVVMLDDTAPTTDQWNLAAVEILAAAKSTATAPGQVANVSATAGSGSATVTWTAPSNGGSPITSYTITPYVGTEAQPATKITGTPPATSATISGLSGGTSYMFTVQASNAVGSGLASEHSNTVTPESAEESRILMGNTQKEHWEDGAAECPGVGPSYCADEISQGQFVAWPFIAEHTGTVEAIFAILGTSHNTGAEIGIYANRKYSYPEINYVGSEGGAQETWTPARFEEYEAETPPEDPGELLGTSGKVAEAQITNKGWTEFSLEKPVKVIKGEEYWLTNTAFASPSSSTTRYYQDFYHERKSTTQGQPWGDYSNEPLNYFNTVRPLKELPSPETTKIDCEKCNTEGWLQEEPRQFELLNANRGAQEEGGQTYSYAYGEVEEGPVVLTTAAAAIEGDSATLNATVNPKGSTVTERRFEYGTAALHELTEGYEASVPCASSPGSGNSRSQCPRRSAG